MVGKQKGYLILVAVFAIVFTALGSLLFVPQANAYPPTNGQCEDGTTPAAGAGGAPADCAESTRKTQQQANGTQTGQQTQQNGKATSCAVEKIGWILCPIIEGSAKVADKLFQFLADHFLQTEPELLSDDSGTKKAWDQAIILANIMFVIAFIVVIYSQITGAGLSNYGIKRMLPRLILAAVMVNLSFYICQAMADLSNLLGYETMTILTDLAKNAGPSVMMQADNQGLNTQTTGSLSVVAVGALAVGGLVWLFLAPLGGIITMVIITCLVVVIILLLRKALIVLLVVASPFAFVAYLLPNTEKLFNRWLSMFWKLLLVFPIVAALMGGGQLASAIILTAGIQAGNTGSSSQQCDPNDPANQKLTNGGYSAGPCEGSVDLDGSTNGQGRKAGWMLALVAAGIAVAPLLAVWSVLKGALAAAGAIGGKIGAAVQKGSAGGVNGAVGLGKAAKEKYGNSTLGRERARAKKIREGDIKAGAFTGSMRNPLNWSRRARSGANGMLNGAADNIPRDPNDRNAVHRFRQRYADQRTRDARGALAERTREKAQEFEGNMDYAEQFDTAREQYLGANNRNDRDEALLKMNAAAIAASRLDDRAQLDRMRPTIRQYSGANRGPDARGPNQATRAANTPNTVDAANAMNQQFDNERAAAMNTDHDAANAMNREFDARQRQEAIQHELSLTNLESSGGTIHDVDLAHEIALRQNARGGPNPGGGAGTGGGAGGAGGTGGAGGGAGTP